MQLFSSLSILCVAFFETGMKTDFFQSCGHCWVFQICWHIECSTFIALSFSIWNSSTGIPIPSLAFFVVMLSKAHLTSHSMMSGSRWVIIPLWLSGLWSSFLYSSSVFSCHLLLISSASVRSLPFLSFIDQPRQHIKKQRHHVNKGPSSQGYGFSSSHVWMWELDYKESGALKNWCFWTVVLEKTLFFS